MEKRILGKTNYSIGIITFGGIVVDQMEANEAANVVAEAVEHGINYFDVAPIYGHAQYILGPALVPYRKEAYLACKTNKRSARESRIEMEESLRALKTDYFDVYQLHMLDDPAEIEEVFSPGGAMETLVRAKEQGIVRNIGFTCHYDKSALEIMRRGEFATMLFPVNFAYREQKEGSCAAIRACNEKGMGIIAIKALAHRKWSDNEERTYPKCWYRPICDNPELARLALNYALTQDITTAVPPGDIRMLRLALDIIERQGGKAALLTDDEHRILKKAALNIQDVIF